MNFASIVQSHNRLEGSRIEILTSTRELEISEIRCAVLFVLAAWSAPSLNGFTWLTEILSHRNLSENLRVIVLNNESLEAETMQTLFGETLHGWGEAFWIGNGKIVQKLLRIHPGDAATVIGFTNEIQS